MKRLSTKSILLTIGMAFSCAGGLAFLTNNKLDAARAETTTYTHVFSANVTAGERVLSNVTWTVSGTNINNYNTDYKGIQFGTKNNSGSITFVSKSAWGEEDNAYIGLSKITHVYVWLNAGSGTPSATVSIGGTDATSDGATVSKISNPSSYEATSKVTFTPADGHETGTISITASTSSKAGYICAIQVECEEPADPTEPSVSLDKNSLTMNIGGESTTITATPTNIENNITYQWVSNNENVVLTDADTATVTVALNENVETFASSIITLTVNSDELGENPIVKEVAVTINKIPTEINPYTVAEAIYAIDNSKQLANVYVRGIISQIDEYNSTYKSITYWISDDGTTTNQFEVYSGKGLDGADFSSVNDLEVGAHVVVYGTIKLYNEVHEFDKNSQIKSMTVREISSITLKTAPAKTVYYENEEFDPTGMELTVTYTEGDPEVISNFDGLTWNNLTYGTTDISSTYNGFDFTLKNLVTVNHDSLEGIELSGEITKKAYNLGEEWSHDGLSVQANYESGRHEDVTASVEWSYSPGQPALKTTSVTITATYQGHVDDVTFNNIEVTKAAEISSYTKVTTEGELESGNYLIVYEDGVDAYVFNGALTTLDAENNFVTATISESTIAPSNAINAAVFTYDAINQTLRSASGFYIGISTTENKLRQSEDANTYHNTIAINQSHEAVVSAVFNGSNSTLRFNTNGNRFRFYSANQQAIAVYKANEAEEVISDEDRNAINAFVSANMHMNDPEFEGEGTGACKTFFGDVKAAFNGLTQAQREIFLTHSDYAAASERLTNWVRANEYEFNASSEIIKEGNELSASLLSNDFSPLFIILMSTVGVMAIGFTSYMILKRKKAHK